MFPLCPQSFIGLRAGGTGSKDPYLSNLNLDPGSTVNFESPGGLSGGGGSAGTGGSGIAALGMGAGRGVTIGGSGFGDATFEFGTGNETVGGVSGRSSVGGGGGVGAFSRGTYTSDTPSPTPPAYTPSDPGGPGDDASVGAYGPSGDPDGLVGDPGFMASGGTVKSKNKNSFMSMKGK